MSITITLVINLRTGNLKIRSSLNPQVWLITNEPNKTAQNIHLFTPLHSTKFMDLS